MHRRARVRIRAVRFLFSSFLLFFFFFSCSFHFTYNSFVMFLYIAHNFRLTNFLLRFTCCSPKVLREDVRTSSSVEILDEEPHFVRYSAINHYYYYYYYYYLRNHFMKNALPVSRLHNKIFSETTLMLKLYLYIKKIYPIINYTNMNLKCTLW